MNKSESIKELATALNKAQNEMGGSNPLQRPTTTTTEGGADAAAASANTNVNVVSAVSKKKPQQKHADATGGGYHFSSDDDDDAKTVSAEERAKMAKQARAAWEASTPDKEAMRDEARALLADRPRRRRR